MTRTVLVFVMAALFCLALTGLRVAVLHHLSPSEPMVAPRAIKEQPPEIERPIEYIAIGPASQAVPQRQPALIWAGALRSRDAGASQSE